MMNFMFDFYRSDLNQRKFTRINKEKKSFFPEENIVSEHRSSTRLIIDQTEWIHKSNQIKKKEGKIFTFHIVDMNKMCGNRNITPITGFVIFI